MYAIGPAYGSVNYNKYLLGHSLGSKCCPEAMWDEDTINAWISKQKESPSLENPNGNPITPFTIIFEVKVLGPPNNNGACAIEIVKQVWPPVT